LKTIVHDFGFKQQSQIINQQLILDADL